MSAPSTHRPAGTTGRGHGTIVRKARQAAGLTLAELGVRTGYSASQVSRYERGLAPLTDLLVLRRFAAALNIAPHAFGLTPEAACTTPVPLVPAAAPRCGAWVDSVAHGHQKGG
ncbi:multiprotein-bridging factor 1 family protein [Spongiactinospora sp. 9N601]|uniref:multiprotein-bridging factor 1 family protein n=1 Tax=Spongiactinospora sp. 9N601 TaxID=3375149 RepID=UPI00379FFB3B